MKVGCSGKKILASYALDTGGLKVRFISAISAHSRLHNPI